MKIKRYKKAGKFMSVYKNNFGFREPYQILLDGTFCQVALDHQVNIQDQLPRYLKGQCKLLTTACVIEETKRLGKAVHGAYLIVSQFPIHNCGHEEPVSASRCLSSFLIDSRNKDHYIVATQDHLLRTKLAKQVVCPLLKLANNTVCLEKPPDKVAGKVKRTHHYLANKLKDNERDELLRLKLEENLITEEKGVEVKKKKKKGPKGPNPLSCKKSKKTPKSSNLGPMENVGNIDAVGDSGQRRKRRKRKKSESTQDT